MGHEARRHVMALRTIAVTYWDAINTVHATYPGDASRLTYAIDTAALEMLDALKQRLPPDSPVWAGVEELERSIDSAAYTAIPVDAEQVSTGRQH